MTKPKKLGIWMDHANAHLMEFTSDPMVTTTLSSDFTHQDKENSLGRSENQMHNREQHLHLEYYKKLGEIIRNYTDVILFGPTDAKTELHNLLKENHLFSQVNIEVKNTDKMTENQQHAFVRDYFSKHRFFHN